MRYDWQVMAPNMLHSVFPISHLYILTCKFKLTGQRWRFGIVNDYLTIADIPCIVRS